MSATYSGKATHRECCCEPACHSGKRNNYYEGKRLSVDSFRVEQQYSLERRRLLNRTIHGNGVVNGYAVTKGDGPGQLWIGPGLALDACGRELVHGGRSLSVEDVTFVKPVQNDMNEPKLEPYTPAPGDFQEAPQGQAQKKTRWLLRAHYAERRMGHVSVRDQCRCEHEEWDHTCETVHFTLERVDAAECCKEEACGLTCDCSTEPCCSDEPVNPEQPRPHGRGGCRGLCDYLTTRTEPNHCGCKRTIETSCGTLVVYLEFGEPLACVDVNWDEKAQKPIFGEKVDACGPRRLVKSNSVLFDLVRGCDLTKIEEIGWKTWHRKEKISLAQFSDALAWDPTKPQHPAFWVRFSRPVHKATIKADCFAITVLVYERKDHWWEPYRVPIIAVNTEPTADYPRQPNDPAGTVRGARLVVLQRWLDDGLADALTMLEKVDARVEIEVRGDFVLDCNGQAVDANAVGLGGVPSGNGTPGGTFLSTFLITA